MTELNDHELLADFARNESEPAFAELVARHVNLVYSTALRFTGNPHHAEEITQAVFIILARKAGKLSPRVVLSGWLYQATRLTAANFMKHEIRRQNREQEAYMQSTLNEPDPAAWEQIAPFLDDAMGRLGEADRNAVVLRFFENRTAAEIAATLNTTEAAAHKRVNRALEKLRKMFTKRGVTLSAAIISGAVAANSVQAAPVGLAKTISAVAVAKGVAAGTSTLTIVKGALKLMAWTKAKTTIIAGACVLLAAGTTTLIAKNRAIPFTDSWTYEKIFAHPDASSMNLLESAPPALILRPSRYPDRHQGIGGTDGKTAYVGLTLRELTAWAYGGDVTRVIMPKDAPAGYYDYLNTLPGGQSQALREAIKKQFGLVAKREIRPTDVLLLEASNPVRLSSFRTKGSPFACYGTGKGDLQLRYFTNAPLSLLAEQAVEGYFNQPCIDRTQPGAKYDFSLQWTEPKDLSGEALRKALRPVIEDQIGQLGLEIVPTNLPIEMLVVERAEN